jgi:hypothetical protein
MRIIAVASSAPDTIPARRSHRVSGNSNAIAMTTATTASPGPPLMSTDAKLIRTGRN